MKLRTSLLRLLLTTSVVSSVLIFSFREREGNNKSFQGKAVCCPQPSQASCVIRTILNLEPFDTAGMLKNAALINGAIQQGLEWLYRAQAPDGGWGAGSHYHQEILDPHAVASDPATTAMVGMALLRCGYTLTKGQYAENLRNATEYLLKAVENTSGNEINITTLTNTQPQVKLGNNIDVILAAQFLTNLIPHINNDQNLKNRVEKSLNSCIGKIESAQDRDGSWKLGGWAPVLQSALANNALESAKDIGFSTNSVVLEKSKAYLKSNFDLQTNSVITGKSAGVLLYAISGSSRASAQDAGLVNQKIDIAKKEGKLKRDDTVSQKNLVKAGMSATEADKYFTAYSVNKATLAKAQTENVMNGFGSNGGEEFLSYLMTGESLVMNGGQNWEKWYDMMTGRLIQIQDNTGCWNGHHCISSPVFCTATCLLVLSINKDINFLVNAGHR
jgi:hypothetical protein